MMTFHWTLTGHDVEAATRVQYNLYRFDITHRFDNW